MTKELKDIRFDLANLESKLASIFSDLLHKQSEFVLFEETDLEQGDTPEDYYEYRNDITGNVIEIHILKVDEYGLHIIKSNDYKDRQVIRFSDLASIDYQLALCECMNNNLILTDL